MALQPGSVFFAVKQLLSPRSGIHVAVHENSTLNAPCSWATMLTKLQLEDDVGLKFSQLLAGTGFQDLFWECRPVSSQAAASQPFDFVVLDAQGSLNVTRPSSDAFSGHLKEAEGSVVSFPNLGRDANLVVPAHLVDLPSDAYGHLAAFVRRAPTHQQAEFWRKVGQTMQERLIEVSPEPVWLSTAGNGVPWVHVRTDSWPKYVKHSEFKSYDQTSATSVTEARHAEDEL